MKNKIQYDSISSLNLKALVVFSRSYQTLQRKLQKSISSFQLTVAQFGVLEALYHLGDLSIGQIINKMLSTGGNMTVVINNLEKDAYITRYQNPEDKRITIVSLTDKGKALIQSIFPQHLEHINQIYNVLDEEEKKTFIQLSKKLSGIE